MDTIPLPDLVVCKICEHQVSAKWLYAHSTLCKDAAELKEIVLKQQSKLSQIVNKAYELRNQLNTNFALQKLKQSRRPSYEYEDSFEMERMPSSPAYIKKHKKYLHFNFIAEQADTGRSGSQTPNPERKRCASKKHSRRPSNDKMQEIEDEFNRAVGVLKSIIQYGNNSQLDSSDVERDINNDYKIKNEVNVLYVAIKDKMISEYLQQFIENIQKYIKGKQSYLRKLEEGERKEYNTSSFRGSDESFSSENTKLQDIPTPVYPKPFKLVSLDDSDVSEVCFERKNRLPDTRWLRRGSAGHLTPLKGTQIVPNEGPTKRTFTTLSKFASPLLRQGSNASQGSPQASPKSAGALLNGKLKKGKIPQKLLEELMAMREFQVQHRKPSRLLSSRRNLKGAGNAADPDAKKKDLKRNQTIHINPYGNTSTNCQTLAHIEDEPVEETKVGSETEKIYEMWKKRQSWNFVAKDIDIKKLLNKPDVLEVCQEEEPPSGGDNNNESPGLRIPEEEKLLSKGDLSSSEDSSDRSSEMGLETEDSDDEFPTVTMKGYYSDSEVTNVRKGEQSKKTDVTIDDFNILKLLGEGAYGKVYLVKKKATGDLYAMKIVNFQDRESTHNRIASLRAESDVYKSIQGDWVVKAYYTFSYESYVCFVMEYMLGGDLEGLLEQLGCFDESVAQFYFGELVLAVESLHCLGIVHRDLKPDNVLIDSTGHIKLTDFGLSEKGVVKLRQRTSTIRNSTLSSLTRNNSLHDSSEKIYNTITKELLKELHESGSYGRKSSGEQPGLDPTMIPSPLTLRRIASTISELSPFHSEPYLVKNKNDEEVVFAFLDNQGRNDSWIPKKKIVKTSEHSTASNRKKELNRIIGTPDYMAPEIIKGKDCSDRSVDLWSLGVILYEFLVGVPPFNDDSMEKIFDNIVNFRLEWPNIGYEEDCITPEAADLIKKLMNPDPKKRITLSEVKKHAFFKNFDLEKVKNLSAPVVPKKKEIECSTPMGIHSIFLEKMSEEMMKEKRRKGIINEDVSDFQMKRIDLLHQLNQSLYNAHILSKGNTTEKAP